MLELGKMFDKLFFVAEHMEKDEISLTNDISGDLVNFMKYNYGNLDIHLAFYIFFIVMYSFYVSSISYGGTFEEIVETANREHKVMGEIIEFDKLRKK